MTGMNGADTDDRDNADEEGPQMTQMGTDGIRKALAAGMVLLMVAGGCGVYSTRPGSIPQHIKNIHIPAVENETAEFGLNEDVNSRVLETLLNENILALSEESGANSILYLSCTGIDDRPYTFDETERVKEYKLTLTMSYRWYDTSIREDIMKGNLSQWSVYYSDSYNNEVAPDEQLQREDAKTDVAKKIAEDVIFQLVSDW